MKLLGSKNFDKQQGFTLVEALVATALFVVIVSSVVGIYISTLKLNRRASAIRLASENARFITESISKEVRNGRIDYYGPVNSNCSNFATGQEGNSGYYTNLAILNVDGDHACFYISNNNLMFIKTGATAAVQVNDNNTQVLNFRVYVDPDGNPYLSGSTTEPRVNIVGTVRATNDPQNIVDLPFQTGISIPAYDIAP